MQISGQASEFVVAAAVVVVAVETLDVAEPAALAVGLSLCRLFVDSFADPDSI